MPIDIISYSICSFVYLIFFIVLLTDKHRGVTKRLLLGAALMSAVWASILALQPVIPGLQVFALVSEVLKMLVWLVFILGMLASAKFEKVAISTRLAEPVKTILIIISLVLVLLAGLAYMGQVVSGGVIIATLLMLSVLGIVLIEQLYRNVSVEQVWVIKYLCLGLLGSFIYNFYMYSDALLYQRIDPVLWQTRGFVETALLPLIALSISRNPLWSPEIFISRRVVFHTTTLITSAIYLFIMGVAGYYVKEFGGSWGAVIQAFFLFSTIMILSIILASRRIRARIKVLVNKHFYPYKFDYREEWLRLIRTISSDDTHLYRKSITSIAQIVDSHGGMLWLNNGKGYYECVEALGVDVSVEREPTESPLPRFLRENEFVINVDEYYATPEVYSRLGSLILPGWFNQIHPWLVIPLIHIDNLLGFIVIDHSEEHKKHFNWEDSDLLKTAARQVASYIAEQQTSIQLAEAKQFEAFNKISTYVVHDIKNLVAQLSLIVSNADRHKNNPLFMDDVIETLKNTVYKMNKMLDVVSNKAQDVEHMSSNIDIPSMLDELIRMKEKTQLKPVPTLGCESQSIHVRADKSQLMSIFGHLIQNAQDATDASGEVKVLQSLSESGDVIIKFIDSGCGMDEKFIRDSLFRPFKSTKGKGMGIGAYETREIIHALGGGITVTSAVGEGTTFTVTLPCSRKN